METRLVKNSMLSKLKERSGGGRGGGGEDVSGGNGGEWRWSH